MRDSTNRGMFVTDAFGNSCASSLSVNVPLTLVLFSFVLGFHDSLSSPAVVTVTYLSGVNDIAELRQNGIAPTPGWCRCPAR